MLSILKNLKIRTKLFSLVIISLAGFVVFDYLGYRTLDFLKVNGPLYQKIIQGKDTIADVLPPPKYIIESYLIAHHMLIEKHPDDMEKLFRDSARLEKEYIERQDFWSEKLTDGELKKELTVLSHTPAMEFFKLRNEMFFPLIINAEIEKAADFLDQSLEPLYQEHRKHIERVVEIARRRNEADERYANKIVFERSALLIGWGIIAVAAGALLSAYFMEQITLPLLRITRAAKKISEGDLSGQDIATDSKDEIGILSKAIEEMRAALQRTLSGLGEKIIEYEQAQEELLVSRNLLEARVKERTRSLEETNEALNLEIAGHRQARQRLNLQYEIASLLAESSSFTDVTNKILGLVCENLKWDFGEIWQVDREANILRCVETWHSRLNDFQELDSVNRAMTFSSGTGLPGRVWADKKAIWVSDVTKDSNFVRAPIAMKEGLRGGFGFPILFGTEVMAVMEFFSSEIRQPDSDILQMFSTLGSHLGQFIERKQAEEKISRLNQELEGRVVERTSLLESALKQLEEANAMNQLLLQSIPFAMDIVDEEGVIIALNPMLEAVFGRQAIGRKCWQLYRDNQQQCPNCPLLKTAETGQTETLEVSDVLGGKIYSISHTVMMYKGKKAILEIFQDITERRRQEQELRVAHEQLKEAQGKLVQSAKMASVGQLAAGVAHEINNPLTGALNNVQLIKMLIKQKDVFAPAEFTSILDVIEESVLRCAGITRSLLDFSTSGQIGFGSLSLNSMAERAIFLVDSDLKLQNIAIEKQLQEDLPLICGEPQLIQQVVFDILMNARWAIGRKAGNQGGRITVKTWYSLEKEKVCLSVSDTGIGISEENLGRIFDPFFTTKPVGEGTGLGLSIVYNIIKKHNGDIEAASRPGEGAVFIISLPVFNKVKSAS